jgi:hypothetical protein
MNGSTVGPGDVASERTLARRVERLREELGDEGIPIPAEGEGGDRLLAELVFARRPRQHEGRIPGYGALVFSGVPDWDECSETPVLVPAPAVPADVLRRFADGQSSFTVVMQDGITGLATFEHSMEDEVSAVRLRRSGAAVVQRSPRGTVRLCAGTGVVLWNGSRWRFKPSAEDYVRVVSRLAPHAGLPILTGLLELAVHSLASARVGATFIWNLDGASVEDDRDGLLELGRSITGPALSVTRRGHFPALRSVEAQVDLATVVAVDGSVGPIGVRLDHSPRAGTVVPPTGGARHTSARRFTFDVPGVLAVVVSESGRVTMFSGGAVAAEISRDQYSPGSAPGPRDHGPVGSTGHLSCAQCGQRLLVASAEQGDSERVDQPCPVCGSPIRTPPEAIIFGVPVAPPSRPSPVRSRTAPQRPVAGHGR